MKVLAQGESPRRRWALVADVANFFASVDQERLDASLAAMRVPRDMRALMMGYVGDACPGGKGLPLGAPFSKLLGNVCLHPVDLRLAKRALPWCRFVDDILVLARSRGEAESVSAQVRAELGELGLEISEPKTGIAHRYRGGIDFLGFRAAGRAVIPSAEVVERFILRLSELRAQLALMGPKKALTRWNRTVLVFGHMYKTLDVRKLFRRLDGIVRLEYREHLRSRGGAAGPAGCFSDPSRFPPNPAFTTRHLREIGLVSLEQIQQDHARARPPAAAGATAEPAPRPAKAAPKEAPAEFEISLALRQSGRLLWRGRLMIPVAP